MSHWENYKNTFDSSENIFSLARSGNIQKLKNFLDSNHGIDINKKNHKGYSPLMIAVYNGNYEASGLLLKSGADPNSSDLSGNTVLMGAAFKGDVELVTLLIKFGSQKDLKNHDGLTAEQWASAFGRTQVVSLLSTKENYSKFPNLLNAVKILWGFMKTNTKKEAIA
jgi:uncharacterized protein